MSSLWGALGGLGDWAKEYGDQISKSALAEKMEKGREDRAQARYLKKHDHYTVQENEDGTFTAVSRNGNGDALREMPADAATVAQIRASNASTKASEGTERRAEALHGGNVKKQNIELEHLPKKYNLDLRIGEQGIAASMNAMKNDNERLRLARNADGRASRAERTQGNSNGGVSLQDTVDQFTEWLLKFGATEGTGLVSEDGKSLTEEGKKARQMALATATDSSMDPRDVIRQRYQIKY